MPAGENEHALRRLFDVVWNQNRPEVAAECLAPDAVVHPASAAGDASGTATRLVVYLDPSSTAASVAVGLYTQGMANAPGALLAQGTIARPHAGAWNAHAAPATQSPARE